MQRQKKTWSQYVFPFRIQEDNALKTLRDVRKIQKWSQIARILEGQFEIKGKNGKRCRERYHNHLSSDVKKEVWTEEEQKQLLQLHNQKGNRWAQIAKVLGRSDNAVKNHYHSKLRKGIRRINYRINAYLKSQHKFLRNNIISKIVQTAEKIYFSDDQDKNKLAKSCFDMKNRILQQAKDSDQLDSQQIQNLKRLVTQIHAFNRTFKKKSKKNQKPNVFLPSSDSDFQKNLHINFPAENQQKLSQLQNSIHQNSSQSINDEDEVSENLKNQLILENKSSMKKNPLRQQTFKKYELRNSKAKQTQKMEASDRKPTKIFIEDYEKPQEEKGQRKTLEVFQEINFKNDSNINNLVNLGILQPFSLNYQYFNYPIFQPLTSSMGQFVENGNSDFYGKNNVRTFEFLMIPQGNLIWGMNNLGFSQCEKPFEPKLSSSTGGQQGFTLYKKQ